MGQEYCKYRGEGGGGGGVCKSSGTTGSDDRGEVGRQGNGQAVVEEDGADGGS